MIRWGTQLKALNFFVSLFHYLFSSSLISSYLIQRYICHHGRAVSKQHRNDTDACRAVTYNKKKQICCKRKLIERQSPYEMCCGSETYNTVTHQCCGGHSYPRAIYDSCCQTEALSIPYNSMRHICCGGRLVCKHAGMTSCCGQRAYDARQSTCCGGWVFPRENFTACCSKDGLHIPFKSG